MNTEEKYMRRCLELARLGAGKVAPNPMVGAVIVYQDTIIGEGWHQQFGQAHAEVNAVNAVKNSSLLAESTIYVNLEPCAHQGKTPPCADLIIASKFKRVVVGMVDPNPLVSGKGIERIQQHGIEVIQGVLEAECKDVNRRFITYQEKKRPYVILKWAQTQNGFIAPDASKMSAEQFEKERHITGKVVQKLVHKWRTYEDAIMIATRTALLDNPALNAREWPGENPLRIIIDRKLSLPNSLKIFDQSVPTWILNETVSREEGSLKFIPLNFEGDWFAVLLQKLYEAGVQSLIIEGGSVLLNYIIDKKYWDEAIVFYSPSPISEGVKAPYISGEITQQLTIDSMHMVQYRNV